VDGRDLRGELEPRATKATKGGGVGKVPKELWDRLVRAENKGLWDHRGLEEKKGIKGDIGPPGIPGIKGEPGESISVPKVTITPALQLTVNESNAAVFFCSASGNPTANVTWTKVNGSLTSDRTKVTSDGLLQIKDVRLEDSGKYICVARNLLGIDEKVATLIIQSRLQISSLYLLPNHNFLERKYARNIQNETFPDADSV